MYHSLSVRYHKRLETKVESALRLFRDNNRKSRKHGVVQVSSKRQFLPARGRNNTGGTNDWRGLDTHGKKSSPLLRDKSELLERRKMAGTFKDHREQVQICIQIQNE